MIYNVELMRFGKGVVRPVELPDGAGATLDMIYEYGQNNSFNSYLRMPSVSVGDIIHFEDKKFIVKNFGFEELNQSRYNLFKNCLSISLENNVRYAEVLWKKLGPKSLEYC